MESLSHQPLRLWHVAAPVASSAYHTCFTPWHRSCRRRISGVMARAYIAMAKGSPCVVPSVDDISPFCFPLMNILTGD